MCAVRNLAALCWLQDRDVSGKALSISPAFAHLILGLRKVPRQSWAGLRQRGLINLPLWNLQDVSIYTRL